MLSEQFWKRQPDYFRSIRSTENMGEIRFTGISTGLRRGVEHGFWRVASRVLPEKACYVQGSGVHASIPRNKLNHVTGSRNRSLKRNMEERRRRRRRRRPLRFSFRAIMITLGRIEIPVLTSGKASPDFDGSIFWNVVLTDWYRDRSLRMDTYVVTACLLTPDFTRCLPFSLEPRSSAWQLRALNNLAEAAII